ncbi:MAG: trimethylamine methyltransferase family protein [Candidatus Omnitrophica bacterium]|nr:trimethylamine methyltransferase family protein [Candidatus Omnitrophota bacterium]
MFKNLKDADMDLLSEGVLTVLEKLGMTCQNKEILTVLEDRGAYVDYETWNARFPQKMIRQFVEEIKKEDKDTWEKEIQKSEHRQTLLSGYVPYVKEAGEFKAPHVPFMFHPLGTFYLDEETGEKRKGNKKDFIRMTKLGDVLHPEHGVGHSLNLSDVPSQVEPLEAAMLLLEYAHNPRGVYVEDLRQIDYLREIEDIMGINDPYWHWLANISFAAPLKLGKDISERFLYMLKSGNYPAKIYTMAISGVNMPVTTAGSIVLSAAEVIALWFSARAVNPKVPLTGMILSGVLNMKTGQVNYWTFDTLIRRLSICEFVRKWTGVAISPGIGEYTPAKHPGFYTTLEKAYLAMTIAAFTGHHPEMGIGHLESGLTLSPVQLLLDREFTAGLRYLEPPVINEETIGLETIMEIGFGIERNYLDTEHTLKNFRSCLWEPKIFDISGWDSESEANNLKKASGEIARLIEEYKKPEVDPEKIEKTRKVIERAKKELLPG